MEKNMFSRSESYVGVKLSGDELYFSDMIESRDPDPEYWKKLKIRVGVFYTLTREVVINKDTAGMLICVDCIIHDEKTFHTSDLCESALESILFGIISKESYYDICDIKYKYVSDSGYAIVYKPR